MVTAYFRNAIMLWKCTVTVINVNYQRLDSTGKQKDRKSPKLFYKEKISLLKSGGYVFQIFFFPFPYFPHFFSFSIFYPRLWMGI
jgi:hypothetical protein